MKPDCRACGICCVAPYGQDVFCDVEPADEKRLGTHLAEKYVVYPSLFDQALGMLDRRAVRAALRTKEHTSRRGPLKDVTTTTCVFLCGSLLERVSCKIYTKRPQVCHVLKPGSPECRAIRKMILRGMKGRTENG